MIKAQEWFEQYYSSEEARKDDEEVDLININLSGPLDVSNLAFYINIFINGNPNLGEIIDSKEDKKTKITLTSAPVGLDTEKYLEIHLNQKVRQSVQRLNFFDKNLSGSVDFSEFTELIDLVISYNQLSSFKLPTQLTYLNCSDNKLTFLDLSNNHKLETIGTYSNKIMKSEDCYFLLLFSL